MTLDHSFDPRVEALQGGYVIRDGRGQTLILESWAELSGMSMVLMAASDDARNGEIEAYKKADELWARGNR